MLLVPDLYCAIRLRYGAMSRGIGDKEQVVATPGREMLWIMICLQGLSVLPRRFIDH